MIWIVALLIFVMSKTSRPPNDNIPEPKHISKWLPFYSITVQIIIRPINAQEITCKSNYRWSTYGMYASLAQNIFGKAKSNVIYSVVDVNSLYLSTERSTKYTQSLSSVQFDTKRRKRKICKFPLRTLHYLIVVLTLQCFIFTSFYCIKC